MKDQLHNILHYVPFLGLAIGAHGLPNNPAIVRLMEAAIIGGIIMFANAKVTEERLSTMNKRIGEQSVVISKTADNVQQLTISMTKIQTALDIANNKVGGI